MGLAERRVAWIARLAEDQARGAKQSFGDEDEMRDNLADITAGIAEPQPIGGDLPIPRPLLVLHDDIDTAYLAQTLVGERGLGDLNRLATRLDEIGWSNQCHGH